MSYRALVLARPLSRSIPPFCPATIMFMRGFRTRSPPVVVSHGGFRHVQSSPRAMDTRQKHDDNKPVVHSTHTLKTLLSSAIRSYGSAEVALLHIMKIYSFSDSLLDRVLTKYCKFSFSKVQYENIAPLVGLRPGLKMHDIEDFTLYRSRIPTALFQSILQDIDIMQIQYGSLDDHSTKEARSQFFSPIFNHLIAIFGSAIKNMPESTIKGHIATKGRMIYHFKIIHTIAILFVEANLDSTSGSERFNAIAQIIAECNASNWNNAQNGFYNPVYGILCDEDTFEFFCFDGTTNPCSFKYGLNPNNPPIYQHFFRLPATTTLSICPFIHALRPICEVIFDLLLNSYISSLKANYNHFIDKGARRDLSSNTIGKWEEAISAAINALQGFRKAEIKRQAQLIDEANSNAKNAMISLKCSVDAVPLLYKPKLLMSGWDSKIEKV